MTHEEFEELAGAYALDAVTPAEREAARAHLAGCAACTRHLQELRAVVDLLPYSVEQVNPPASSKERLLEAIHMESTPTRPQPVPMQRRERPPRHWGTQLLAIAAVFVLILFGGMTVWNVSLHQQNSALQQQNTSLKNQATQTYDLRGTQGTAGTLIYLPAQHITLLTMEGLPQLQGTQVYQGWLIHGKQPTSIGLLSVQNGVASVVYSGNLAGYQVAAVSREPGPGASKNVPAGPIVATGQLQQAHVAV